MDLTFESFNASVLRGITCNKQNDQLHEDFKTGREGMTPEGCY